MAINPFKKKPIFLLPALVLLIAGIWIEKGIGLIVPGLVPSPMGEIIDYAPSNIELMITFGVISVGIFMVTMLIKPALIIEKRYDEEVEKHT